MIRSKRGASSFFLAQKYNEEKGSTMLRYFFILLSLSLFSMSCGGSSGGGACADSPIVGAWSVSGNLLVFTESCDFASSGTCTSTGLYSGATAQSGVTPVIIQTASASNPPGSCYAVGSYNCTYAISGEGDSRTLSYVCH